MKAPASTTEQPEIAWPNLVRAIQNKECILVLGPDVAKLTLEGKKVALRTLLATHIEQEIRKINPTLPLVGQPSLAYLAKTLEDLIFVRQVSEKPSYTRENARKALSELIAQFYGQYTYADFEVYTQLAKMPFHFVVETTPAPYLAQALDNENKFDAKCYYYHYADPSHNNKIQIQEAAIRPDAPLVYHLFGSVEQPDSMVFTEHDQLLFLDAILQQENTASIPNCVAIHFTSVKDPKASLHFDKTFVFLGFDFNEWHLRIMMHLIGRYQRQKETYALQNPKDIAELTEFFYRNNFDVRFVDIPPQQFLSSFEEALQKPVEKPNVEASPKLNVFLMYAQEDEALKNALDAQLNPLKKTELIETWDESQMLPGAEKDEEITRGLMAADIVLLLVSPHFFGPEEIYGHQLRIAMERHEAKQTVVIPLLMSSCNWELSVLDKLTTILPRNRMALDKQDNPALALADTVAQLNGWCKKIFDRKKLAK